MEDGWVVKTVGEDENAKMDPRRLPAGMTAEGRRKPGRMVFTRRLEDVV
jgi:hypothetical protein